MDVLKNSWMQLQDSFPTLFALTLNITAALAILITGLMLAGFFKRKLRKSKVGGSHIDATLRSVLASAIFYIIAAMTIYAVLRKIGVDAASLLAVFGAAGLAIGLALKDTLSNIASGVMLLVLRPMQIGEYIDTPNIEGTIIEIGLFATTLKNAEGVFVYVPNAQIWNARLTNFDRHDERRLIVDIGVGYETDLRTAQKLLIDTMTAHPNVDELPAPPECHVMNFEDSAIILSCRCWLPAENWLANTSDIRIAIKAALDETGINIPYPQRVITTKST